MVRQEAELLAHDRCAYALRAPVLALDQRDLAVASQYQIDPAVSTSLARFLNLVAHPSIGLGNQLFKLAPAHGP